MSNNFKKMVDNIIKNNKNKWDNFLSFKENEFHSLMKIKHDSPYHDESVYEHIEMCLSTSKYLFLSEFIDENEYNLLNELCIWHDIGKPFVKVDGRFILHEVISSGIYKYLNNKKDKEHVNLIQYLISIHLIPHSLDK